MMVSVVKYNFAIAIPAAPSCDITTVMSLMSLSTIQCVFMSATRTTIA